MAKALCYILFTLWMISISMLTRQQRETNDKWLTCEINRVEAELGTVEFNKDLEKSFNLVYNNMRSE